jgi:hypothetical protein
MFWLARPRLKSHLYKMLKAKMLEALKTRTQGMDRIKKLVVSGNR